MDLLQAIQSVFAPSQPSPAVVKIVAPVPGNSLVVVCNVDAKDSASVTDDAGNVYTEIQNYRWTWEDLGQTFAQQVFYLTSVSGVPTTITVTTENKGNVETGVHELQGFKTSLEITLQARASADFLADPVQAFAVATVAVAAEIAAAEAAQLAQAAPQVGAGDPAPAQQVKS
jgi:hypothetical protein